MATVGSSTATPNGNGAAASFDHFKPGKRSATDEYINMQTQIHNCVYLLRAASAARLRRPVQQNQDQGLSISTQQPANSNGVAANWFHKFVNHNAAQ